MKVSFDSKGDFENIQAWLKDVSSRDPAKLMQPVADKGTARLKQATPKDTGETSEGWVSEISKKNDVTEVAWKNKAHPETEANVALLIELGHGTGTGGYVQPRPYIKDAMEPAWDDVDKVVKELIK